MMEKIWQLVAFHYQLGGNGADNLETLWERWVFLDPNSHNVYNLTVENHGDEK